jgi:hypothetical protein
LFLISSSFQPYFIWNFWNFVVPPFSQIKSNSFEIHLNNSQSSLFIQTRPTSSFPGRPTRTPRLSLLPPSPTAGQCRAARSIPRRSEPRPLSHALHVSPELPPLNSGPPAPFSSLSRTPSVFKSRRPPSRSPLCSAPSHPRSSTPPPPPSFPKSARQPRTPGPRFSPRFPPRRRRRLPSPVSR